MARANDANSDFQPRKELSWTGIIAGALVALALSFLINSLNLGLGLSAFTTNPTGMMVLAIGAMIWLIICSIVTMFIAGWVAGYFARKFGGSPFSGVLNGFLAWSLALVVALFLASNVASGVNNPNFGITAPNTLQTIAHEAATSKSEAITPSKTTEREANTAGITALATFFIFLFGAAASGAGGYYAMKNRGFRELR